MNIWTYTEDNEPKPDNWDNLTEQEMKQYLATAFMYEDLREFLGDYSGWVNFQYMEALGTRSGNLWDSRASDLIDKAQSGKIDLHSLVTTVQSWLKPQMHKAYDATYKNITRIEPHRSLIIDFGDWIMEGDLSDLISTSEVE